ncbi:MAG: hypothetical protein M5U11_08860 [Anaerolineales bacterium]|nr:hypothetical protein [Anaerolineales bacterium]
MNQTNAWRRKVEEYEADLYRDQTVTFLFFSFQRKAKRGEIEVKKYDNREARVEVEFFGVEVPGWRRVYATADGKTICQVEVRRGAGRLRADVQAEAVAAIHSGSTAEIRHMGQVLMAGSFRPD